MALEEAETMIMEERYDSARHCLLAMQMQAHDSISISNQVGSLLTLCEVLSASNITIPALGVDHYWVLRSSPLHKPSQITAQYRLIMDSLAPLLLAHFPPAALAADAAATAFSVISHHHRRSLFDSHRNAAFECLHATSKTPRLVHAKRSQDFFDFDYHRDCHHIRIRQGQIWAAKLGPTYRYGRVTMSSEDVTTVTWLRPIPLSACERRWCQSGLPVSCGTFELGPESETTSELVWVIYNCHWAPGVLEDQFKIYPQRGEVWAIYKDWDIVEWAYCGLDSVRQCKFELVEITSDFSVYTGVDCAYLVKVDGFRCIFTQRTTSQAQHTSLHIGPAVLYMFSHKVPAYRFNGGEIDGVAKGMLELDRVALPDCILDDAEEAQATTEKKESLSNLSLLKHRCQSAKDFGIGQVWALRIWDMDSIVTQQQYAKIEKSISDFQVCVTVLEPIASELALFKVSTSIVNIEVSRLSYKVKYRQISDQVYEIQHPKKGEIWAMHKERDGGECEVVQIVSDMSEGDGGILRIARLEEVKGCLTFFQRQRQECEEAVLSCFSHRIAAFRVPGIGRHGIPESAWHLEPNQLPDNLIWNPTLVRI